MAITMIQSCEMCGKKRDLPTGMGSDRNSPRPDSGGWRELSHGSIKATLCDVCVTITVDHARLRAQQRANGHAGELNDRPLVLQFSERGD